MKLKKYLAVITVLGTAIGCTLPASAYTAHFNIKESNEGHKNPFKRVAPFEVTLTHLPEPAEPTFDLYAGFKGLDLGGKYEFLKLEVQGSKTGYISHPEKITKKYRLLDSNGYFSIKDIPFNGFKGGDLKLSFIGNKYVDEGKYVGYLKGKIDYKPVPEPATMLGTLTALGVGGFLKQKYAKKA